MTGTGTLHTKPASGREMLRNRDFSVYFVTAMVSNAGSFMQSVSVPFVLYELTGSNTWVGLGTFAWLVPSLLVSPWSGTVSDRFDRRLVLLWSNLVQLAAALGLFALAAYDAMTPWRIVSIVVVGGAAAGFQYSAAQAITAVLLPPEQLLQGIRLNSVGFTASRAIGPAVAGLVLDMWGAKATFGINALSFVVLIVGLAFVRVRPAPRAPEAERWRDQFRSGLSYVMARPALRLVVISALVAAFFGQSMVQLAAGLAKEDFGVEGRGFGLLAAVYGMGAVLSSLVLVAGAERVRRSRTVLFGLGLFATGIAITVATRSLAVGIVGFLVAGTAHSLAGVSLNTSMQAQVDEEYRGRALSMFLMALLAGMPFGALVGGLLGDHVGLRWTLFGYAVALVVYVSICLTRFGRLGILDAHHPTQIVLVDDRDEEPATVRPAAAT